MAARQLHTHTLHLHLLEKTSLLEIFDAIWRCCNSALELVYQPQVYIVGVVDTWIPIKYLDYQPHHSNIV